MGEYVMHRGHLVKIGTCEDLYYVRYADFARMVATGEVQHAAGNAALTEYMDGLSRFRFPFPDEDMTAPFMYDDYDKGFLVNVSAAPDLVTVAEHRRPSAVLHPRNGGYQVSVSLPCPQTPDFKAVQSSGISWYILEIVQQRPFEGALWTVCRCPYCGARWRLDAERALTLTEILADSSGMLADYHALLARRILEGYEARERRAVTA